MGCGASKAAQVSEEDINILNHPAKRTIGHETEASGNGIVDHQQEEETEEEGEREGDVGVGAVYSGQSEIERAVMEATGGSLSTATPSFSSAVTTCPNEPQTDSQSVPPSLSAPMVFEVCMSPDDRMEARAPPPLRMKKQDSSPVVTAEMLEMKQLKVAERKKEELEKRLGKTRLSKKDRLRKEIMAAREMQSESGEDVVLTENFGYTRLHEESSTTDSGAERREEPFDRTRNSYDTATHMEGDTAYNIEEGGEFWSSSDGHQMSSSRGDNSRNGSTNNLEL